MSLFGNSYEDAVYKTRYPRKYADMDNDWYKEKAATTIEVDCNGLDNETVNRIFAQLTNYPCVVDDDEIILDEKFEEDDELPITNFKISGNYSWDDFEEIEKVLNRFNVRF